MPHRTNGIVGTRGSELVGVHIHHYTIPIAITSRDGIHYVNRLEFGIPERRVRDVRVLFDRVATVRQVRIIAGIGNVFALRPIVLPTQTGLLLLGVGVGTPSSWRMNPESLRTGTHRWYRSR